MLLVVGIVLQTILDSSEVEVKFLHPHGPAQSFKYPEWADILVKLCSHVNLINHLRM